jgi:hypothetical protein
MRRAFRTCTRLLSFVMRTEVMIHDGQNVFINKLLKEPVHVT